MKDLKNRGYDDETAYRTAIDSIGDIEEIIESISGESREPRPNGKKAGSCALIESISDKIRGLGQTVKRDLSMSDR